MRRWWRKRATDVFELLAVLLIVGLVFRYWGPFWAGVPVAVYFVVLSIGLGRGGKR